MNIDHPKTLEDYVFFFLQKGPMKTVDLIEKIKKSRSTTTKQGVYVALRALKKREVVVMHAKQASLSSVWLDSMARYFSLAQHYYVNKNEGNNSFLNLQEGERLQYFFKNPIITDAFWSHVFYTLVETSSPDQAVVLYNPHDWFLLVRHHNEKFLLDFVTKRHQKYFLVAGHNDPLDKLIQNNFDGKKAYYERLTKPLFTKGEYYVNIIGDFVIEVWIDNKIAIAIDVFYKKTHTFGQEEKLRLEELLSSKGKTKLTLSRNKRKATLLRKKLQKYFIV